MTMFLQQYQAQSCRCFFCGVFTLPQRLTREHIVPHSKGGKGNWDNLVLTCEACNNSRENMTIGSNKFNRWYRKLLNEGRLAADRWKINRNFKEHLKRGN